MIVHERVNLENLQNSGGKIFLEKSGKIGNFSHEIWKLLVICCSYYPLFLHSQVNILPQVGYLHGNNVTSLQEVGTYSNLMPSNAFVKLLLQYTVKN